MSLFSSGASVDTGSFLFKVCLHETAHAVIARGFGWTNPSIRYVKGKGWGFNADLPKNLDRDEVVLQRAVVLLAGPAASIRVSMFMPSGCDWDKRKARELLRGGKVATYDEVKAEAKTRVGQNWGLIKREARGLYLAGGESP